MNRLAEDHTENIAYSRFLNNESVSVEELISVSTARCNLASSGRHVLAIQDTTELNFQSHRGKLSDADPELGPVGNDIDIGFFLHPSLIVDVETEFPLGFGNIHLWNRCFSKEDKDTQQYKKRPIEEKESFRWIESAALCEKNLADVAMITQVEDREGDIYESFARVPNQRTHLLVRSSHNRILVGQEEKLFPYLASQPLAGTYHFKLKGDGRKKRTGRDALMEVRFTEIHISRPANLSTASEMPENITLFAVEAREHASTIPAGETGVYWRLITTHKVLSYEDACQIIHWYRLRWLIEQLFRSMKSQGLKMESSQLEDGGALKKLTILALQVALQIMQLVQEREGRGNIKAEVVFNEEELFCLEYVGPTQEGRTKKQQNPYQIHSLAWAAWILGRLGGWKGYISQGKAGPISMRRGLFAFEQILIGWKIAQLMQNGRGGT